MSTLGADIIQVPVFSILSFRFAPFTSAPKPVKDNCDYTIIFMLFKLKCGWINLTKGACKCMKCMCAVHSR
jgi:hypothetical protein